VLGSKRCHRKKKQDSAAREGRCHKNFQSVCMQASADTSRLTLQ